MTERTYTIEELKELGLVGQKHDTFATSNQAQFPHGFNQYETGTTGGLFTRPGAETPTILATRNLSPTLLGYIIQRNGLRFSRNVNPEYEIITGVKAAQGSAGADCGDAQYAGFAKVGTYRASFGKFRAKTERVQLTEVGSYINAADMDRSFLNLPQFAPFVPDVLRTTRNPNTVLGLQLYRLGVATERAMAPVVYNGTSGGTSDFFTSEFDGLDNLIKTGYVDIESGNLITAADSVVVNRASVPVTTTTPNIVTQIGGIYRILQRRAVQTGLAPLELVLAMHPDLFEALTRVWAQTYYTEAQIGYNTSTPGFSETRDMVALRDEMRNGSYLLIRGQRIMVFQDDAIELTTSGAGFDSDIYFVPTNALGTPVTYFEAFDMGNAQINEYRELVGNDEFRVMNGGLYMTFRQRTAECLEYFFIAKPRLILRTPWLAGRLTNVNFALENYQDSPFPADPYFVNGGRYEQTEFPYVAP